MTSVATVLGLIFGITALLLATLSLMLDRGLYMGPQVLSAEYWTSDGKTDTRVLPDVTSAFRHVIRRSLRTHPDASSSKIGCPLTHAELADCKSSAWNCDCNYKTEPALYFWKRYMDPVVTPPLANPKPASAYIRIRMRWLGQEYVAKLRYGNAITLLPFQMAVQD